MVVYGRHDKRNRSIVVNFYFLFGIWNISLKPVLPKLEMTLRISSYFHLWITSYYWIDKKIENQSFNSKHDFFVLKIYYNFFHEYKLQYLVNIFTNELIIFENHDKT